MNDTEITRKCAEAMEAPPTMPGTSEIWAVAVAFKQGDTTAHAFVRGTYDPLRNDGQAMALLKKFNAHVDGGYTYSDMNELPWQVEINNGEECWQATAGSLNRAICECVAKMRSAS